MTTEALQPQRWRSWLRRETAVVERDLSAVAHVAQWALVAIAGLALWFGVFGVGLSALQEQHAQHDLYAKFRSWLALGTAPLGGPISEGSPVALLRSQAGALHSLVVVEGTTSSDLRAGPGHVPGTVLPGQVGVSYLFGRSVSYGGPFRHITALHKGDVITAITGQGRFKYVVQDVRREGDPYTVPTAGQSWLMLVTSEGTGWRSGWAPSRAVYVDALLQGKAVTGVAPSAVLKKADLPMRGDTSGLWALVLWLQLLVVAVIGIVIGRAKWGTWQPWLIGVPIVLAALWGASSYAWMLLPNLV